MSALTFVAIVILMIVFGIGNEPLFGQQQSRHHDDNRDWEPALEQRMAVDSERARQKGQLGSSAKKSAERWVTVLSLAWVVAVFGVMFAIVPSRPMGSLEQWAYFGPTLLIAAIGPTIIVRAIGAAHQ